jgi:nitrate/TMAO reductase-like tetraheme cytochrome c subunit
MNPQESIWTRFIRWLSPLVYFSSNALSLIGVVVVTAATVSWIFLLPMLVKGSEENPYIGIPGFLLLPGIFIFGLVLIPLGIIIHRARHRKAGHDPAAIPTLTLNSVQLQRIFGFFAVTTVVNMVIVGQWGYSAVNYMDTQNFCGQTCHTVMQPEYTAYLHSPHTRVTCVECHIGSGASWFVRSKLSGVGQVFAVAFNTYPRPLHSPVVNLRPARETCEQCHSPQHFSGDLFKVNNEFASTEQNDETTTVLLMKVGGVTWRGTVGIHGQHSDNRGKTEYITTDGKRQVIPQVIYTGSDGKQTIYNATDVKVTPEELAKGERRTMDCMDCHNRPTHIFQMPDRSLNQAMSEGRISPKLPFIKKQALDALQVNYPDRDTASRQIASTLTSFYQTKYPGTDAGLLKNAIAGVQAIYLQNIFPEMKVTWGSYPSNLGHMDSPGCFRCHDGNHTSADGRTISNDCSTCHDMLAMQEKNPKILTDLGYHGTD